MGPHSSPISILIYYFVTPLIWMMLTETEIYEVLRECYDPEIPVNIVDLGLVYGVEVEGNAVNIIMTLTAPGCQMGSMIAKIARTSCAASRTASRPMSRSCGIRHGRRI